MIVANIASLITRLKPNRRIEGISAVLLPFDAAGGIQWENFRVHLLRTHRAGLQPAVNMDTGFGPQLTPAQRDDVLRFTRDTLGPGAPFVAGAQAFNAPGDALAAYRDSVATIVKLGGTPIIFQSPLLAAAEGAALVSLYREIGQGAPAFLAFELGPQFAPFGRIYDLETYRKLMAIPNCAGAKHSSLSRALELDRLAARDADRPAFKVYTGNDLAIDLVMYGSDYLLGLSCFDPEAFALRDRWWAEGDPRFYELNDALQAVGMVAFRDPVPAYKDSCAAYLNLTGRMTDARVHPACPRRPAWESDLLAPLAKLVAAAVAAP
jgi:dihydrodipicolinate synthase/N-acetylneuraminate lyase